MIFKKKKSNIKCENCSSSISNKYSFCPNCGNSQFDQEKESKDFGMLGRTDSDEYEEENIMAGFGITDKLINSLVNNLAKSLDKQFKDVNKEMNRTEVRSFPNGIKIRIGPPIQQTRQPKKQIRKSVTESQIKKMSELPRTTAKSSIKRLGDKVIYQLETPGVSSQDDIFISKLESGYEVKAIGSKKVFVNNLPINLPLNNLSLLKNKLLVEFNAKEI